MLPESEPLKGFCYGVVNEINQHRGLTWKQCHLFNAEEKEAILQAVPILHAFLANLERLEATKETYTEFKNELHSLRSNNRFIISRVDRRFRAYVMEWRLFLDHWKKYIDDGAQTESWPDDEEKQKYIEDFQKLYADTTMKAYENCPEYVIAYTIRNHVSHAANCVYAAHVGYDGNRVAISRDALLSEHKISKSQREVVEKQDDYIDLEWVADGSMSAMQTVMETLIGYQIDSNVVNATVALVGAYERIKEAGIDAHFWMYFGKQKIMDNGAIDIEYQSFDFDSYVAVARYLRGLGVFEKAGETQE